MENYFVPNKRHLREVLLFCFHSKKSAAESHRMMQEAYGGENTLDESTCRRWFRKFNKGNFDIEDAQRPGQQKKFADAELQALLNEDKTKTQSQLAALLKVTPQCVSDRLIKIGLQNRSQT